MRKESAGHARKLHMYSVSPRYRAEQIFDLPGEPRYDDSLRHLRRKPRHNMASRMRTREGDKRMRRGELCSAPCATCSCGTQQAARSLIRTASPCDFKNFWPGLAELRMQKARMATVLRASGIIKNRPSSTESRNEFACYYLDKMTRITLDSMEIAC